MRFWLISTFFISLYCAQSTSGSPLSLTVDLGYAKYQGVAIQDQITNATHTQFLGIRYAAPPTGDRRWKEPTLPASQPGIQLANQEPPMCLQAGIGTAATSPYRSGSAVESSQTVSVSNIPESSSEDCLFLNVYVPGNLGQKSNLPVVVFIHGGGYVLGSASVIGFGGSYDGNDIVRASGEGVIFVIFQYRLGLFGFLPGQKVKDSGNLNAGLLDQQFALKWVQQHIGKFGGDPRRVTIWGQSAGAGSVLQHIIANGGRTNPPLFRGAMTSSTFLPAQFNYNARIPEMVYNQTIQKANCSTANDTLECLRSADVEVLQAANLDINNNVFFGTVVFAPVIDGTFIRDRPLKLLKQGNLNGKGLLSVSNAFEGAIFVDPSTNATVQVDEFVSNLFPSFGAKEIQAVVAEYAGLGSNFSQVITILGEGVFICPSYSLSAAFGQTGYRGLFAVPPGNHGDDLHYYFPTGVTPTYTNPQFDTSFPESFLNFALSLDPNVKWDSRNITPFWKKWSGATEMLFNRTAKGQPDIRSITTSKALLKRCKLWQNLSEHTPQ